MGAALTAILHGVRGHRSGRWERIGAVSGACEVDVLVVGAGQAGLGTAYWLTRRPGLRVLVVDGRAVGQSWLDRWDSLERCSWSAAATGTTVHLADGTDVEVGAVLWCTAFLPDTTWLEVPGAVDDAGGPLHQAGDSPVAGLHWMGLPWQTRLNSSIIDGVDRDARATADRITGEPSDGR